MPNNMPRWRQIWLGGLSPWGKVFNGFATLLVGLFGTALLNITIQKVEITVPWARPAEPRTVAERGSDVATTAVPVNVAGSYEIPYEYWGGGGNVESIVTTDEQGREAELRIHTLSKEFNWTSGENGVIELEGQPEQVHALREHLREMAEPGGRLHRAKELIVVGTASCERGCDGERDLAKQRATQLGIWLKEAKPDFGTIHRLVLGGWAAEEDCHTYHDRERRRQRRVLLLEVERRDAGVVLEQSLKAAIAESASLDFEPEEYCDFLLDLMTD